MEAAVAAHGDRHPAGRGERGAEAGPERPAQAGRAALDVAAGLAVELALTGGAVGDGLLEDEPSEAEFGLALDTEMRRLGADGPSFETIVAAGSNAGMPHHRPGPRRITEGDLAVRVPLVGRSVEGAIVSGLREHLAVEIGVVEELLADL